MYTKPQLFELLAEAWEEIADLRHHMAEIMDGYTNERRAYADHAKKDRDHWRQLANRHQPR